MKATQWFLVIFLAIMCAGCTRGRKLAGLYVPARCIQKVSWTKPCDTLSEHVVKCDGVLLTTSCVSSGKNASSAGHFDARVLPQP
ncbi:MAG TPA: hypothetical protein VFU27_13430 [Terriglobales bacterium]|nr:hypothetical protein [Terriglobales bacterium]